MKRNSRGRSTLDDATHYAQSYSGAEVAFERVYDQPLDDVIDEYETEYPRCGTLTFRDKGYDCSRNVIEIPATFGQRVTTTVSLSCDDPAVLGPRLGKRWTTITLDIPVRGRYYINGRPLQDGPFDFVEIRRCDASCFEYGDDELSQLTGDILAGGLCVDPGRYLFKLSVDEDVENEYELSIERSSNPPCD